MELLYKVWSYSCHSLLLVGIAHFAHILSQIVANLSLNTQMHIPWLFLNVKKDIYVMILLSKRTLFNGVIYIIILRRDVSKPFYLEPTHSRNNSWYSLL